MRLRYRELKDDLKDKGEPMTFKTLADATGIDEPRISEYSTGKAKQIRSENADIITTHFRRKGYGVQEIWEFEENDGPPTPVRTRSG